MEQWHQFCNSKGIPFNWFKFSYKMILQLTNRWSVM